MMMMTIQDSLVIWAYTSSWGDLGGLISGVGGGGWGGAYIRGG